MALQSSGPITLLDVAAEFGGAAPHSLNEYYGVASGVPTSGVISLNDFYGKSNEVTLRIYPSGYGGASQTNIANASDGDLNTYATISTASSSSIRTGIGSTGSLAAYGEYYVKSVRIYSKFMATYRQQTSTPMYVDNRVAITQGTSNGTIVILNFYATNVSFPMNTVVVHDTTANAVINAKVNTLYGYQTTMGLNVVSTYLETNNGGYANTCRLYEHFYDLTLSATPPL